MVLLAAAVILPFASSKLHAASPPPLLLNPYIPKSPEELARAKTLSPGPIEDSAADIVRAAYQNDGKTLFRYAWPEEIKKNHLTAAKIEALWREAVLPHIAKAQPSGPIVKKRLGEYAAIAQLPLATSAGHALDLGSSVTLTPSGHRQVLLDFMFQAWIYDYVTSRGIPLNATTYPKAYILGIRRHKALFKKLGIEYRIVRMTFEPLHVDTWDEAEASLWKKADKLGQSHDLTHIP